MLKRARCSAAQQPAAHGEPRSHEPLAARCEAATRSTTRGRLPLPPATAACHCRLPLPPAACRLPPRIDLTLSPGIRAQANEITEAMEGYTASTAQMLQRLILASSVWRMAASIAVAL